MNISQTEFERRMEEGQNLLLGILAESSEVSVERFYKVANVLEFINLFSGVIYHVVSIASQTSTQKSLINSNKDY